MEKKMKCQHDEIEIIFDCSKLNEVIKSMANSCKCNRCGKKVKSVLKFKHFEPIHYFIGWDEMLDLNYNIRISQEFPGVKIESLWQEKK